jgi:hypothetical protein
VTRRADELERAAALYIGRAEAQLEAPFADPDARGRQLAAAGVQVGLALVAELELIRLELAKLARGAAWRNMP